jgi:hypothetical protein
MNGESVGVQPTVGDRLGCPGCGVEVIVIRAPQAPIALTCGGEGMVPGEEMPEAAAGSHSEDDGTLLGKRYADPDSGLELLCTNPGPGGLEVAGAALEIKAAKSLPSSD